MRMENEFGGVYHQMDWSPVDLILIHDVLLSVYDAADPNGFDYTLLNIADRIEKELGME